MSRHQSAAAVTNGDLMSNLLGVSANTAGYWGVPVPVERSASDLVEALIGLRPRVRTTKSPKQLHIGASQFEDAAAAIPGRLSLPARVGEQIAYADDVY